MTSIASTMDSDALGSLGPPTTACSGMDRHSTLPKALEKELSSDPFPETRALNERD